jgi:ribonuclease G
MGIDAILVNVAPGETRTAFLQQGMLERLVVDRADEDHREGDLFLGRVTRVVPAIEAAFVDLGLAAAGFLAAADVRPSGSAGGRIGDWVREGQTVLVQVIREAEAGKGAKLTTRPRLSGRYLEFLPGQSSGGTAGGGPQQPASKPADDRLPGKLASGHGVWLVRPTAANAPTEAVLAEGERLLATWNEIGSALRSASPPLLVRSAASRTLAAILASAISAVTVIAVDDPSMAAILRAELPELAGQIRVVAEGAPAFADAGVDEQIEAILAPAVRLPSGGTVILEETAGGTVIDVDSGSATAGEPEAVAAGVNLEAAAEIVRQIRLRDLSGYLLVDFLPMRRRSNRDRVLQELRRAFANDGEESEIGGFTRFGRVEINRRRRRPSLPRRLTTNCPLCTAGRTKSPLTVAFEALRRVVAEDRAMPGHVWRIAASPAVIAALRGEGAATRSATEARLGRPLDLVEDERIALDRYAVWAVKAGQENDGG